MMREGNRKRKKERKEERMRENKSDITGNTRTKYKIKLI